MTPEWSDFKVLLALARAGSVAGAARELQVDSSTVSRRLAALEEAVGATLLIRGGREFTWTAEGRALLEAGEAMEAATTLALRNVRTAKVEVEGAVRVSVAPAFVPVLMRLLLPTLRATRPSLTVELDGAYQIVDLARGDADIAVRMARPEQPDLVARQAFEVGWFVYAAAAYIDTRERPATFDDLPQHHLVLYSESMHRVPALKWMDAHRAAARELSRVDNLEIACQTISAGGGIGVLPGFIGDAVPELVRVFPDRVSVSGGWIVYHEAARNTSRIRLVANTLAEFFDAHSFMFAGVAEQGPGAAPSH